MNLRHRVEGPEGAPVLVLVHALGTTLELWQPQLPALASRFRVLRYDLRGHGGSDAPPGPYGVAGLGRDLLGLLDRLDVRSAAVCGLSLGGAVAMWVAAAAPERVEALALFSTAARFPSPGHWLERARVARDEGMEAVAEIAVPRWFSERFVERHPELVRRFRRTLVAGPAEGYAAGCEAVAAWDFRDRLERIEAPTLVLAGALDTSTPPEHGERLARGIPGARLVLLDEAAHLANVEQPGAFDEALLEHLDAVSTGEAR